MMDSEHQLKAEWSSVSSINTTNSLSSDNFEQLGGMQPCLERKAFAPRLEACYKFCSSIFEGINSKPPSQLFNHLLRREFGDQNQSQSKLKLKSVAQLMGEKEFGLMD